MFRAPGPGRGQVVDFLQLPHYPIFNIADSAIVSAAVLIAVMAFRGISIDGTRASAGTRRSRRQPDEPEHPENKNPEGDDPQTHRSGSENSSAPQNPTGKAQDV